MLHDDEIAALRREYRAARLDEDAVAHEPIAQFRRWFDDAVQTAEGEPNAMTLATVSPDGRPAARVVLLKGVEEEQGGGFLFFTNYGSDKGRMMAENPAVALVFHWHALERQVRVEGRAEPVSREMSEAYFAKRPRSSQLGAWASPQSEPVAVAGGAGGAVRGGGGALRGAGGAVSAGLGRVPGGARAGGVLAGAREPAARPARVCARQRRLDARAAGALKAVSPAGR
jgi:pyridoxamine-phosphate oxidase